MIDTGKVTDRRKLRFESLGAATRDAEQLAQAERAGTLRSTGNWTLGQSLGHVAAFANYPFDGYPAELSKPPWLVKFILGFMKNRYIRKSVPAGVKIPKVSGGTVATEELSTDEGLRRFKAAFERLSKRAPSTPNVIFGPLTHEEWMQLQCRHAELHLSFFHRDGKK